MMIYDLRFLGLLLALLASVYLTGQNTRMSPKWYSNEEKLPTILKI
jgi:hypothetical protein